MARIEIKMKQLNKDTFMIIKNSLEMGILDNIDSEIHEEVRETFLSMARPRVSIGIVIWRQSKYKE